MSEYNIFEVLPDGSLKWRARASGSYDKARKLQEFAESSENRFHALDIAAPETRPANPAGPRAARRAGSERNRRKNAG
jgi:hypothetical protein